MNPHRRARRGRSVLVTVLALGLSSACAATPHASEDIGVRTVGMSLAFKDPKLALPPRVVVRLLPRAPLVPPAVPPGVSPPQETSPPGPPKAPTCPARALPPERPAPLAIASAPKPGTYLVTNKGTVSLTTGGETVTVPYPRTTVVEVRNIRPQQSAVVPGVPAAGVTPTQRYDVVETISAGHVVSETYEISSTMLALISRSEQNGPVRTAATYSPPVQVYSFQGVGARWVAAGADLQTGQVTNLVGTVPGTRVVAVCGHSVDTQEVSSQEATVGTDGTTLDATAAGKSDVTDIATGLGGLFVKRERHRSQLIRVDNAFALLTYDVVSTFTQLAPRARTRR